MSEMKIPEHVGDLFPHRFRPAKDDEGFATGHLMPCDSGQWIATVHAFNVAKSLIERIAILEAERDAVKDEMAGPLTDEEWDMFRHFVMTANWKELRMGCRSEISALLAQRAARKEK